MGLWGVGDEWSGDHCCGGGALLLLTLLEDGPGRQGKQREHQSLS